MTFNDIINFVVIFINLSFVCSFSSPFASSRSPVSRLAFRLPPLAGVPSRVPRIQTARRCPVSRVPNPNRSPVSRLACPESKSSFEIPISKFSSPLTYSRSAASCSGSAASSKLKTSLLSPTNAACCILLGKNKGVHELTLIDNQIDTNCL